MRERDKQDVRDRRDTKFEVPKTSNSPRLAREV